ncbi:MAG: hypothetical protein R3C56_26575 [Pirellulaceae bacterium]
MSVTASLVQRLHRINRQKTDLNGQLGAGSRLVSAATRKLQAAVQHVSDTRSELTKFRRSRLTAKQLQMREREEKIHKWARQLELSQGNREYQALKDQSRRTSKLTWCCRTRSGNFRIDRRDDGRIASAEEQVKLLERELAEVQSQLPEPQSGAGKRSSPHQLRVG